MSRTKFRCVEKTQRTADYGNAEPVDTEEVTLRAVIESSWKWRPSGAVQVTIENPEPLARFEVGKDYFLDFTEESDHA